MKPKILTNVGLDLGSYSVKCVEVSHTKEEGFTVDKATIVPVTSTISAALKSIVSQWSPAPRSIRVSISGPALLIRRISLPLMTKIELKSAIRFEAEKHIPFPINDCVLDTQILKQNSAQKTMDVLLVAAKKDFIEDRIKLLTDAGVKPSIMDVDIFCVSNAFEKLNESGNQKAYGIVHIGHQITSLAILHEGTPFFVREVLAGGQDVAKASKSLPDAKPEEATRQGFEKLIHEIHQSIDYFENESGESLDCLWLSGGGAQCAGVEVIFSEELGKKVQFWNGFKKIKASASFDAKSIENNALELNAALGMAIRETR